jgi:hypothetical protein
MNVIGDIAGQYEALMRLVDKMPYQPFILLGDLNDRGWQSKEVIQWAIDNSEYVTTLDSNHGDLFTDWYYQKTIEQHQPRYDDGVFEYNGGRATLSSYGHNISRVSKDELLADVVLGKHIDWLADRPSHVFEVINGQKYLFSHAPLTTNPHRTFAQFLKKGSLFDGDNGYIDFNHSYLWNRDEPYRFHPELPDTISVFGHNSGIDLKLICGQYESGIYCKGEDKLRALLDLNKGEVYGICLDTSRDAKLTGLDLSTMTIYHEPYIIEAKMY